MKVKKIQNGYQYQYSKDLDKEIPKCEKELERIEKILPYLEFSFTKAKKELDSKKERAKHLRSFIKLIEEKQESDKK